MEESKKLTIQEVSARLEIPIATILERAERRKVGPFSEQILFGEDDLKYLGRIPYYDSHPFTPEQVAARLGCVRGSVHNIAKKIGCGYWGPEGGMKLSEEDVQAIQAYREANKPGGRPRKKGKQNV